MTGKDLREAVVLRAVGWLGLREADGTHGRIIDIYNGHRPLPRGYRVKYTDAWCAAFVSACAISCGLTDIIPVECSCTRQIELLKKLCSWQERDDYVPAPGDLIYYDWQDTGRGDNTGTPDHVGIVEKVAGDTISVIEGNYKNAVGRRTMKVNGRYIRGFGVPRYSAKAERMPARTEPAAAKTEPAAKAETGRVYVVCRGDSLWAIAAKRLGSGARYKEIMALNGLKSDVIHPGQVLKLPEK